MAITPNIARLSAPRIMAKGTPSRNETALGGKRLNLILRPCVLSCCLKSLYVLEKSLWHIVVFFNHVSGLFPYHDGGRISVPADYCGHDAGVDDSQPSYAAHAQSTIHH